MMGGGCTEVVELPTEPTRAPSRTQPVETPVETALASGPKGVEVVVGPVDLSARTRDGLIRGGAIASENRGLADRGRLTILGELATYPASFLESIGLNRVLILESLSFDGASCRAFADVERGMVLVDISACDDDRSLRGTLHHELFHQVDFADDGRLDADPEWEALNPPGFRYPQDARRYQSTPEAGDGPAPAGFLTRYATSSPTEDKAVLYEGLVTDRAETLLRVEGDPVLRQKVERLRVTLETLGADPARRIGP